MLPTDGEQPLKGDHLTARASDPDEWIGTPIEERYQAGMRIAKDARFVRARLAASRALAIANQLANLELAPAPEGDPMWDVRGDNRRRETFALPHPDDFTGGLPTPQEFPGLSPNHLHYPTNAYSVGTMKPMQNTITPRTPLTLTELETLATMLDSGTRQMYDARDDAGRYVWGPGSQLTEPLTDILAGFYQIRESTATMICGDSFPWETPEGQITVTGRGDA